MTILSAANGNAGDQSRSGRSCDRSVWPGGARLGRRRGGCLPDLVGGASHQHRVEIAGSQPPDLAMPGARFQHGARNAENNDNSRHSGAVWGQNAVKRPPHSAVWGQNAVIAQGLR